MSQEAAEDFLQRMQPLIRSGRRHFVRRTWNGKDYIDHLAELGITSIDGAWNIIRKLNKTHWLAGPEVDRADGPGSQPVVWVFKMEVNGFTAYIKLKDETGVRGCVCMSFHKDNP